MPPKQHLSEIRFRLINFNNKTLNYIQAGLLFAFALLLTTCATNKQTIRLATQKRQAWLNIKLPTAPLIHWGCSPQI